MNGLPTPPATGDFQTPELAAEHLCDHVLTRPEAHDWPLVLEGYRAQVDPSDDDRLEELGRSLFTGAALPAALELLRLYREASCLAIDDALRLGWWWEESQGSYSKWCGFGLAGVFVVWDRRVLQTGLLHRNSQRRPYAGQPRTLNPLPRRARSRRLPPPALESARSQYHLFSANHYLVSKEYEVAYNQGRVGPGAGEGARIFIESPPVRRDWERLFRERP